jgi:diguanylate cyclase (GGDEF)-like protein
MQSGSGVGSEVDQRFDNVFQNFIAVANKVEKILHQKIQADLAEFRKTGFTLLFVSAVLAFVITVILLRNRKRNTHQLAKIQQAKQEIEVKNIKLQNMAHYDFLTQLPNRALFTKLLKTAIAQAERNAQWLVLFFIDLDQFKSVNDSLGHQTGDLLLQGVAERLNEIIRAEDNVARLAGDEFTILLAPNITEQQAIDTARNVAKKIQWNLADSFQLNDMEFCISASIGIALYPKDGNDAESLLNNADRSMYDVKQMGKNNFRFFSAEIEQSAQRRLQLETELRKAIRDNELQLYYQPQWNFKTGQLFGLEALVRWNHPQKGMIFPNEFISIAETCGLIHDLDMWVLDSVCKQIKQWENEQLSPKQISVNLSAIQFSLPGLVRDVAGILAENQVSPKKMELEIIESILMDDAEYTLATLNALKSLGFSIAVDDFGTGYSSMAYLSKFPIDTLKIDRVFIQEIESGVAAKVIIESIIQMATRLGLTIVAEGIETAEQNRFLVSRGCTYGQGYFYNRPMPVKEIDILLHEAVSIDLLKQEKIVHLFPCDK